ncbi:MAG: hypothetical protein WCI18_15575 [Pseudomonadota bacterium]
MKAESKLIPFMDNDESIYSFIRDLKQTIKSHRVSYIQARWKSLQQRRAFQRTLIAVITLQRFYRTAKACKPAKLNLQNLKKEKATAFAQSAAMEAARAKAAFATKKFSPLKNTKRNKRPLIVLPNGETIESDFDTDGNEDIDEWLLREKDPGDIFDSKMGSYLATERLSHYKSRNHKKKITPKFKPEMLQKLAAYGDDLHKSLDDDLSDSDSSESGPEGSHAVDKLNTGKLGKTRKMIISKVTDQVSSFSK